MTSAEMLKTRIPPGYLFRNRGRLGHEADWVLVPDQRRIETKEKKMKRIGKGREWEREITAQDGTTTIWKYTAVTRMAPFRLGRPEWSEYEEPYLCWNRQRYYLSTFSRPEAVSPGLSMFDGVASISYGSGLGIRLGDNDEGQLIYFYAS